MGTAVLYSSLRMLTIPVCRDDLPFSLRPLLASAALTPAAPSRGRQFDLLFFG